VDHADHVALLRDGVPHEPGTWADLGAGEGAFTLALADLLPHGSLIHAIDRDARALAELGRRYAKLGRGQGLADLHTLQADFTRDLGIGGLDGIVMANSLHFVKDKGSVLARVRGMLKPGAPLVLVEYDTDGGNQWVPYPLSFETWRTVAPANGFDGPRLLATHPSRFLRRMFSASAVRDRS
jgi:ubiquinone/menaquinone biosynthesis C-methylase UbiE